MVDKDDEYLEIVLPHSDHVRDDGRVLEIAVTIKNSGKNSGIWRVHAYDPDEFFPSNFHAHNAEEPEVLDIYTGRVYSKVNKKELRSIPPKVMRVMYDELIRRGKDTIQEKLSNKENFIYLNN